MINTAYGITGFQSVSKSVVIKVCLFLYRK